MRSLFFSIIYLSLIFLLHAVTQANAAEMPQALTIADCPAGSLLKIEDTENLQISTQPTSVSPSDTNSGESTYRGQEAPKKFITGCVQSPEKKERK